MKRPEQHETDAAGIRLLREAGEARTLSDEPPLNHGIAFWAAQIVAVALVAEAIAQAFAGRYVAALVAAGLASVSAWVGFTDKWHNLRLWAKPRRRRNVILILALAAVTTWFAITRPHRAVDGALTNGQESPLTPVANDSSPSSPVLVQMLEQLLEQPFMLGLGIHSPMGFSGHGEPQQDHAGSTTITFWASYSREIFLRIATPLSDLQAVCHILDDASAPSRILLPWIEPTTDLKDSFGQKIILIATHESGGTAGPGDGSGVRTSPGLFKFWTHGLQKLDVVWTKQAPFVPSARLSATSGEAPPHRLSVLVEIGLVDGKGNELYRSRFRISELFPGLLPTFTREPAGGA